MSTLVAQYNRLRLFPNGQINAYLDCCAMDNGVATLMDYFKMELTPLTDVEATILVAQTSIREGGYGDVPEQFLNDVRGLVAVEHTAEVRQRFAAEAYFQANGEEDPRNPLPVNTHVGVKNECCLEAIDILASGYIMAILRKCVVVDGVITSAPKYHSITLHPMSNVQATLNIVAKDLVGLGHGPVVVKDLVQIEAICKMFYTPKMSAAFRVDHYQKIVAATARDGPKLQRSHDSARAELAKAQAIVDGLRG